MLPIGGVDHGECNMKLETMSSAELAQLERATKIAKAKKVPVSDNIAKRMKINGGKVVDASEPLPVKITKSDVRMGATKNATSCAAARAICREGFTEARVHAARTYVRRPDGKWLRYQTPPALRSEIVAFDRGGVFEPGDYKLVPIQPSQTIGQRAKRKNYHTKSHGSPNSPKRKNHVTTGIRARFIPE
jgi:hypothetical protein